MTDNKSEDNISRKGFLKILGAGAFILGMGGLGGGLLNRQSSAQKRDVTAIDNLSKSSQTIPAVPNNPFDYYVFIDRNDNNKVKAKSGKTGAIDYVTSDDVATVINPCITQLVTTEGGGKIYVGAGVFPVRTSIIVKSNIQISGTGHNSTIFRLADGTADLLKGINIILSSKYPTLAFTNSTDGDGNVILEDFQVDGNMTNNPGNVWGITKYGFKWVYRNITIHHCATDGLVSQWSNSSATVNSNDFLFDDRIENLTSFRNGRFGVLWEGPNNSFGNGWMIYENGEAGVYAETMNGRIGVSGYDGSLFLSNCHIFYNGQKHLAPNTGSAEVQCNTYMRMTSCIVESDAGIGVKVNSASGSRIPGVLYAVNCESYNLTDCAVELNTSGNDIDWVVHGIPSVFSNNMIGIRVLADGNTIRLHVYDMPEPGQVGIQIGNHSIAVADALIQVHARNVKTAIDWVNPNNNAITLIAEIKTNPNQTAIVGTPNLDNNNILVHSTGAGTLYTQGKILVTDTTQYAAQHTAEGSIGMYIPGVGWRKMNYYP
jgi:hypothetical protein